MQNNLTPHPGDYVRVYIPGRQKLVPCQIEAQTEQGYWHCRPLKKCSVDLYIVPSVQIIGKINPKEITPTMTPSIEARDFSPDQSPKRQANLDTSERGTLVPPHPTNGIKNTENDR